MNYLDLKQILEFFRADLGVISRLLFPDNAYPQTALKNVVQGKTKLNADQVYILADFLDVSVDFLYSFTHWREQPQKSDNVFSFKRGKYTVNLNMVTATMIIFAEDEPILFDKYKLNTVCLNLNHFFDTVDLLINNLNEKSNV